MSIRRFRTESSFRYQGITVDFMEGEKVMKSSEEVVMAYVRQLEDMEEEVSRLLSENRILKGRLEGARRAARPPIQSFWRQERKRIFIPVNGTKSSWIF